ncbi:MAG: RNA polymerase sigma factor [Bacteroidetes bacterium]|nr:RNA polymerase sigma factor [Bacteroidota bacterium]
MNQKHDIEQFIRACRQGNRQAQFAIYQQYAKAMLNTSFRILNHQQDAEDALQEAFLKAFRQIDQYRSEASFGAWLKRIVVNTSVSHLRKRRNISELDQADISDPPFEGEQDSNREKVNIDLAYQALHSLPDGYRTVFSLFVMEGYDHQEIGQILGISVSTSISQLSRAKKKIRSMIKERQEASWIN